VTMVLDGIHVVSLAVNVPGPVAAAKLHQQGAIVTKVEPPRGDPLAGYSPSWYAALAAGQTILTLDLKHSEGRHQLAELLATADVLLTATRPAALARLNLGWDLLHESYSQLCHVAIVGYAPPNEELAGHDLTYQAMQGLVTPPHLPRTLLADLAGAEQTVSTVLALLLGRERGQGAGFAQVALDMAVATYTAPLQHGLTGSTGLLDGSLPTYNLYQTKQGWIAVAALEPHFAELLAAALQLAELSVTALQQTFAQHTADTWATWAAERNLPIVAVREYVGTIEDC